MKKQIWKRWAMIVGVMAAPACGGSSTESAGEAAQAWNPACPPGEIQTCEPGPRNKPVCHCESNSPPPDGGTAPLAAYEIVAGMNHSCALLNDRSVRCWGFGYVGPTTPALSDVAHIFAGANGNDTCAVKSDGSMECFGPDPFAKASTAKDPELRGVTHASVSSLFGCAVVGDQSVRCWGEVPGLNGGSLSEPTGITFATSVATTNNDACALVGGGAAQCFGNVLFTKGLETVPCISGEQGISGGVRHFCATDNVSVKCWGADSSGDLGGVGAGSTVPNIAGVEYVGAGAAHSCAALYDGTVRCWGSDSFGQLGGSSTSRSIPNLANVSRIAAGGNHNCAVLRDGTVRCWGDDRNGQLGGSSIATPVTF